MGESYEFGPFRVDSLRRVLLRDGKPVRMSNKALDLLLVLVRERERVLDKEELLDKIWPDTTVEENNLTVAMSGLRKALGEEPTDRRYVVTMPGRGYRFAAEVRSWHRKKEPWMAQIPANRYHLLRQQPSLTRSPIAQRDWRL